MMQLAKLWISRIISFVLVVLFLIMVVAVIVSKASGGEPTFFGYQIKTVLSGSMEPGIKTGSIIAINPDGDMTRFKEDDVIIFKDSEEKLITHRIIEVRNINEQVMYITKGDNNDAADREPVLSDNVVGQYIGLTIPYVGYAINYANSSMGAIMLLVVPGILLLGYAIITTWRAISELEGTKAAKTTEK
ncbi:MULTISPECIES: signal peptidase I SipW [Bacillaceae]|uniref:signal peptidase I SipW n=1 Tax=Bacillaceae TaxID=186817 RepID=UPI001BDE1368|nr:MULTISPECIES: signal peptidase I [Bacillaceae]MDX8362108.1 signal peptidase I [Cytobacillus sp. IB215316]